jgi:hypothetical protein
MKAKRISLDFSTFVGMGFQEVLLLLMLSLQPINQSLPLGFTNRCEG